MGWGGGGREKNKTRAPPRPCFICFSQLSDFFAGSLPPAIQLLRDHVACLAADLRAGRLAPDFPQGVFGQGAAGGLPDAVRTAVDTFINGPKPHVASALEAAVAAESASSAPLLAALLPNVAIASAIWTGSMAKYQAAVAATLPRSTVCVTEMYGGSEGIYGMNEQLLRAGGWVAASPQRFVLCPIGDVVLEFAEVKNKKKKTKKGGMVGVVAACRAPAKKGDEIRPPFFFFPPRSSTMTPPLPLLLPSSWTASRLTQTTNSSSPTFAAWPATASATSCASSTRWRRLTRRRWRMGMTSWKACWGHLSGRRLSSLWGGRQVKRWQKRGREWVEREGMGGEDGPADTSAHLGNTFAPPPPFFASFLDMLNLIWEKYSGAAIVAALGGQPGWAEFAVREEAAPTDGGAPFYVVYVEPGGSLDAMHTAATVDAALARGNDVYALLRARNNIRAAQVAVVRRGTFDALKAGAVARGAAPAQYKAPVVVEGGVDGVKTRVLEEGVVARGQV